MRILIETIPHDRQLYETVGDWYWSRDGESLYVMVSDMGDKRYEALAGLHEAVEALLCDERHIPEAEITGFDLSFEASRQPGNTDEPGDDPGAPYRKEHFFATSIERLVAAELGVDWKQYEETVNAL